MTITIRTRSCNDDLFNKMRSFIPDSVECIAHTAYDDWTDAARFLHDAMERTPGMLLICDEDCFITDWDAVHKLFRYLDHEGILFAGVPDGGELLHRCFSWCSANPSFVLFNMPMIRRRLKDLNRSQIDGWGHAPDMDVYKPWHLLSSFVHGQQEPFNGLFYCLLAHGKPLYLHGETLGDGYSTAIKGPKGTTIAVHTWMSREKSEKNQQRIQAVYEYAMSLKNE